MLVGLATNAASNTSRWPGPLDLLRTQPWWSLLVLAVAGLVLVVVTQPKSAAKTDEDLRGKRSRCWTTSAGR
ncbi:hypothetical protein ACFQV2_13220 [Actinokineospora soli]|uniref:Uncharacterized protein n=1 Tax=Actinokineospora soli TaxID=1048753 RepID=A0ABW2TKR9_9PSEU